MNSPTLPDAIRHIGKVSRNQGSGTLGPVATPMPEIMRIESIDRGVCADGSTHYRAVLFHQHCAVCVDWVAGHEDERLQRNSLVNVRHAAAPVSVNGALRIEQLIPADHPSPSVNIFETVLPSWVGDRDIVKRAAFLWDQLPLSLRCLVNAVLWNSLRFQRFVMIENVIARHLINGKVYGRLVRLCCSCTR